MYFEFNNQKFLFIHIGATAGTSIEYYFYCLYKNIKPDFTLENNTTKSKDKFLIQTIHDPDFLNFLSFTNFNNNSHLTLQEYSSKINNINNIIIFTVVRNPYNRILAKFFTSPHSNNIKSFEHAQQLFENFIIELYEYKTDFSKKSYLHTRCQSNYFLYNNLNVFVLKFENINNDFYFFQKLHNLPHYKLVKINSTFNKYKIIELYTEKAKQIVYSNNKYIIDNYYNKL